MRSRNIKPGFFKNELLAELPYETRLLFIGLWTMADREGRLEDRSKRIWVELFPYDGNLDVEAMLDQLKAKGFISRYEVKGFRYIEVCNFIKHQDPHYREKASEIPPPPGRHNLIVARQVTRTQRRRIIARDGGKCVNCGATDHLCVDHIVPVTRGGSSDDSNLQTLCWSCNTKKGNKLRGETKQYRKPRGQLPEHMVDVGSTSGRPRPDQVASVPLIPSSLIPDSLPSDTADAVGGGEERGGGRAGIPAAMIALVAAGITGKDIGSAKAVARWRLETNPEQRPKSVDLKALCQLCWQGRIASVAGVSVSGQATYNLTGLTVGETFIPKERITFESIQLTEVSNA